MTEDIEERFRQACSAYLLMAEQLDRARDDSDAADRVLHKAIVDANQARDKLLQVVRERDQAAQLAAAGPPVPVIAVIDAAGRDTGATIIGGRIVPSPRAQAAAGEFRARYLPANTAYPCICTADQSGEYIDINPDCTVHG